MTETASALSANPMYSIEYSAARGTIPACSSASGPCSASYSNVAAAKRCAWSRRPQEPRVTRVLPRGNWQDESGPIVEPAVPAFLKPALAGRSRLDGLTRLDLRELVDVAGESADRPGLRQPALEAVLRHGPQQP